MRAELRRAALEPGRKAAQVKHLKMLCEGSAKRWPSFVPVPMASCLVLPTENGGIGGLVILGVRDRSIIRTLAFICCHVTTGASLDIPRPSH
ncbi:uncharacterized protein DFL_005971 [Arthrobotrys flagrans]|uniref:Uncharacterized protein n=1 Tax=Arthrobotrys flagrans TaxID=97331 RepID=A0A436ZZD5_ARTFL|nr:hypothetical protein DFL_005971 [Arthrobotrys flagrans]